MRIGTQQSEKKKLFTIDRWSCQLCHPKVVTPGAGHPPSPLASPLRVNEYNWLLQTVTSLDFARFLSLLFYALFI